MKSVSIDLIRSKRELRNIICNLLRNLLCKYWVETSRRVYQNVKSINRKVRKAFTQSSQRDVIQLFAFAFFAITLRSLRLKPTFDTRSG